MLQGLMRAAVTVPRGDGAIDHIPYHALPGIASKTNHISLQHRKRDDKDPLERVKELRLKAGKVDRFAHTHAPAPRAPDDGE